MVAYFLPKKKVSVVARYRSGQPANRSKTVKKRTYASRTPQARSYKRPSRMAEQGAGMGNVLRGVARVVGAGGKARAAAGKPKPNPGSRTAKKNTAKKTTAKKTTGRKPAQKDVLTRGEQAQLRAEAAKKRAMARGDYRGAAKQAQKRLDADAKSRQAAKARQSRRDKARKRPARIAGGTAAGVGFGAAAGGAAIAGMNKSKSRPKRFRK